MDEKSLTTFEDLTQYIVAANQSEFTPGNWLRINWKQLVFKFPNGYGASVVRGSFTYGGSSGKFELAVTKWNEQGTKWSLCYTTPITDDVIGWLEPAEVIVYLRQILALPPATHDDDSDTPTGPLQLETPNG